MNTSVLVLSLISAFSVVGPAWSAAQDPLTPQPLPTPSQSVTSSQVFAAIDRQTGLIDRAQDGSTLSYAADGSAMALSQRNVHGTVFGFGAGSMSARFFGLEASGLAPLELHQEGKFNAPYYAMLKDASHAGVSFVVGEGGLLRLGALSASPLVSDPLGPVLNEHARRFLSSAEFEQKIGNAVGILTVGILRENGAMLGSQQGYALALNTSPTTTFTSASLGYALNKYSSLVAMISYGRTEGFGGADSLISQLSTVRTRAYSVGFASSQIFNQHDRFGLTFAMPAKVRAGDMQYTSVLVQNGDPGTLSYGAQALNLRPTGTERDLEMTYTTMFGKDARQGKLTGAVMYRVNPGHDASAAPDWLIGIRYTRGF